MAVRAKAVEAKEMEGMVAEEVAVAKAVVAARARARARVAMDMEVMVVEEDYARGVHVSVVRGCAACACEASGGSST